MGLWSSLLFSFSILFLSSSFAQTYGSEGSTSVNDSASSSIKELAIGLGVNYAVYTYAAPICEGEGKTNPTFCMMAAMSSAQVLKDFATAAANRKTEVASGSGLNAPGAISEAPPDLSDPFASMGDDDPFIAEAEAAYGVDFSDLKSKMEQIRKKTGVGFNEETGLLETPSGDMSLAQAQASLNKSGASLPQSIASKISATTKKLMDSPSFKTSMAAGGTNKGYSKKSGIKPYVYTASKFNYGGFGLKNKKVSVKGLSRKLASGESIGVAAGNIFETLSERYATESRHELFDEKLDPNSKY